jgi:hypothetical protein
MEVGLRKIEIALGFGKRVALGSVGCKIGDGLVGKLGVARGLDREFVGNSVAGVGSLVVPEYLAGQIVAGDLVGHIVVGYLAGYIVVGFLVGYVAEFLADHIVVGFLAGYIVAEFLVGYVAEFLPGHIVVGFLVGYVVVEYLAGHILRVGVLLGDDGGDGDVDVDVRVVVLVVEVNEVAGVVVCCHRVNKANDFR